MSLLELQESRSNLPGSPDPTVLGIIASSDSEQDDLVDIGLLPIIYHVFEDTNTDTTILLDEGSNTSLITMKVAKSLGLKGRIMLTVICREGDKMSRPLPYTHHVLSLKDQFGKRHTVKCIEVPYTMSIQRTPDFS